MGVSPIWLVASGWDVGPLQEQLANHPELWDEHRQRTVHYNGPHGEVSDIWVRYNHFDNFTGDMRAFNEEHVSVWYPGIAKIPAAWKLSRKVMRLAGASQIGGVLITRIRPGGKVHPHTDGGWHAGHYRKFCVSVKADRQQAFCFDDARLETVDGDVFEFRNDVRHWVDNDSDRERISLIICVR